MTQPFYEGTGRWAYLQAPMCSEITDTESRRAGQWEREAVREAAQYAELARLARWAEMRREFLRLKAGE